MYLKSNEIKQREILSTRDKTFSAKEALALLDDINELYVSKGKKIVHFDLRKEKPDAETLKKLMLGRSGNLRAPAIRKGKKLIVGFNEETYSKVIG